MPRKRKPGAGIGNLPALEPVVHKGKGRSLALRMNIASTWGLALATLVTSWACAASRPSERPPAKVETPRPLEPREIFEKYATAIVSIAHPADRGKLEHVGTGFLVDPDGVFLTNYHVLAAKYPLAVKLEKGDRYDVVECLHLDKRRDIAVGKIDGFDLPTVRLGNSDRIATGDRIVVIGKPLWDQTKLADGRVSGIVSSDELGYKMLQHTAPISPGSSGSPVFDEQGSVVGIASSSVEGQGIQSVNFAVPINYARGMMKSQTGCPSSLKELAGASQKQEKQAKSEYLPNVVELRDIHGRLKRAHERASTYCLAEKFSECARILAASVIDTARYFEDARDPDVRMAVITLAHFQNAASRISAAELRAVHYLWGMEFAVACLEKEHADQRYRTVFKDFIELSESFADKYGDKFGPTPVYLILLNAARVVVNEVPRIGQPDGALWLAYAAFASALDDIKPDDPVEKDIATLTFAFGFAKVVVGDEGQE